MKKSLLSKKAIHLINGQVAAGDDTPLHYYTPTKLNASL